MLRWGFLAFVPSALLLAVTMHIVTDIVSAPLIWVLPLALYLLTFVIAFSRRQWISPVLIQKITPAVIALALAHTLILDNRLSGSIASLLMHLTAFGIISLMCHQRLAALRPAPAQLTGFYLMLSVGGALGGLINAFAAPMLLDSLAEYPLFLLLACFAHPSFAPLFRGRRAHMILLGLLAAASALVFLMPVTGKTPLVAAALVATLCAFAAMYPRATIGCILFIFCLGAGYYSPHEKIFSDRNFFGILRVTERDVTDNGTHYRFRDFSHGTTLHGLQIVSPESMRTTTTTYFHDKSPIAEIFRAFNPRDVAVAGLGAGTLACHRADDRHFTFYEVDPAVIHTAQTYFTFLSDCPGDAPHRIVEADGRLGIAAAETAFYDMIILDAFSSDSIPPHLITVEAIRTYLQRLNAGGIIVFNISSRYFDIASVLVAAGDEAGLYTLHKEDIFTQTPHPYIQASHWVVMSPDRAGLAAFAADHEWFEPIRRSSAPAWHDNYSNILGVLKK